MKTPVCDATVGHRGTSVAPVARRRLTSSSLTVPFNHAHARALADSSLSVRHAAGTPASTVAAADADAVESSRRRYGRAVARAVPPSALPYVSINSPYQSRFGFAQ